MFFLKFFAWFYFHASLASKCIVFSRTIQTANIDRDVFQINWQHERNSLSAETNITNIYTSLLWISFHKLATRVLSFSHSLPLNCLNVLFIVWIACVFHSSASKSGKFTSNFAFGFVNWMNIRGRRGQERELELYFPFFSSGNLNFYG